MDSLTLEKLIDASFAAKEQAYCPYSKFPVGAALLGCDDKIYTGCNVECAVYPMGICAERNAISTAVSLGCRKYRAIVICSNIKDSVITPCGACRQYMAEFSSDLLVYMTKADRTYKLMTIDQLLPLSFGPSSLQEDQLSTDTNHSSS